MDLVHNLRQATELDCTAVLFKMPSVSRSNGEDTRPSLGHHLHLSGTRPGFRYP